MFLELKTKNCQFLQLKHKVNLKKTLFHRIIKMNNYRRLGFVVIKITNERSICIRYNIFNKVWAPCIYRQMRTMR